MNTENPYVNRCDVNIERLMRQKKWARVVIIFASIGIFAGLSAGFTFYYHYKLVLITTLALISAVIAACVVYIHVQFLRDIWQIWTYQLKYWSWAGFALQAVFCMGIFILIALGIYNQQSVTVDSYYVASVWSFMSWKWSFTLFYRSRKYRSMFTRYSLIGVDSEVSDVDG